MKIALVHDQLQEFGGAERVLVALKEIYPEADVYTSFYNPKALGIHAKHFKDWKIFTSWGDKIGLFKRFYSPLRFLTPYIWEPFNFDKYDVVISSSGSYMCKGIITKPQTKHICYIHHPPRYLYYYETAIEWQKHWPVRLYAHLVNHDLRQYDYLSSQRVDYFIANSEETKRRVEKFYRRDSEVIYPSVTIPEHFSVNDSNTEDYFVTTSRLARAKHVDILIKAANKEKFKLKVIGKGRDAEYLKSIAGPTVEFLSNISDEKFHEIFAGAKAFLFSAVDEEFGIAPIEAMGHGIPVIAYTSGGLIETVNDGENGYLFTKLHEDSLIDKINLLNKLSDSEYKKMRENARKSSEQYSFENFKHKITSYVNSVL